MPRRTRSDAPRFDSRISWEIRVSARVISECCRITRAVILTSFPVSLGGIQGCPMDPLYRGVAHLPSPRCSGFPVANRGWIATRRVKPAANAACRPFALGCVRPRGWSNPFPVVEPVSGGRACRDAGCRDCSPVVEPVETPAVRRLLRPRRDPAATPRPTERRTTPMHQGSACPVTGSRSTTGRYVTEEIRATRRVSGGFTRRVAIRPRLRTGGRETVGRTTASSAWSARSDRASRSRSRRIPRY